jgi:hypothetical protein
VLHCGLLLMPPGCPCLAALLPLPQQHPQQPPLPPAQHLLQLLVLGQLVLCSAPPGGHEQAQAPLPQLGLYICQAVCTGLAGIHSHEPRPAGRPHTAVNYLANQAHDHSALW